MIMKRAIVLLIGLLTVRTVSAHTKVFNDTVIHAKFEKNVEK